MKNRLIITGIICALSITATGCKSADTDAATIVNEPVEEKKIEVVSNIEPVKETQETAETSDTVEEPEASEVSEISEAADTADEIEKPEVPDTSDPKTKAIVWLGDSLTQGSLGDNNDNLPGAPYETLKKFVNVPVEGYGLYGTNTHDIFWAYRDEDHFNQKVDPDKTYIFWVGSCDWCPDEGANANTAPVIAEIDNFIAQNGGVKNYIVIGTTSRHRLGDLYIPINKDLAAHYGQHYMDCIDIINQYGYSPDRTHLSQATYDAVAKAVYEKLKTLGYI
ncbi:MAG: SGNH/GDSL hydrolase family protein [Lachnospiraceae bacterium]|nr:SGNH/GDSL hydrolase family protein [Lachnospiraceae bacterium]